MEQWKNFKFSNQELQKSLNIDEFESYKDELFHRTLAVKLWTNTTYNAKAFKQTTIQSWKLKNPVQVQDLNKNLYLFRFSTKNDADNVFNNGPWCFDKSHIVLRKITGEEQLENFDMDKILFWVRVYDLPLKLRSDSIAKKFGDVIGVYEGIDQRDVYRMGRFLRIRVLLDLNKPLVRGTLVCYQGRNIRVFFKYEKLQRFCFICGRIGHQMKVCDENVDEENEGCEEVVEKEYSFGQWLRASPPPKINNEEKKDRSSSSCRKSLFAYTSSSEVEDLETRKGEEVVMEQNKGLIVDEVEVYKDGLFCRTLAVKLWTNTSYNAKAFKQTTIQSWKLRNPVEVQDLNKNLYLFRFSTKKDAENVLQNGPWSFDKNLIILQKITGEEQPAEFDMHKVSFWVRIYDLPLQLRSDSIAKKIGDFIGVHEETYQREIYRTGSFLRIRVLMDLKKPLMRGTVVCYQGRSLRVFFKYERLPTFCFNCGRIGHQKKTCEYNEEEEEGFGEVEEKEYSFGPWLKASPPPKTNYEEKDSNSSSCRKSLFACTSSSIVEESEPIKGKEVKVEQNKGNAKSKEQCLDFEESGKKLNNKEVENVAESFERVTLKKHDCGEVYP
ncbi:hypothetical protein TSUD_348540 [Trifolium subterraneum]|uniref:CCHC-type domain-containing protein n=1 Tax=Trifolium subterraneum TaxID=3900 RepID=A0A2Z6NM90_TRISU|nr:hypothetical protein TSUD_348540 [Trifolium subterraneum]